MLMQAPFHFNSIDILPINVPRWTERAESSLRFGLLLFMKFLFCRFSELRKHRELYK